MHTYTYTLKMIPSTPETAYSNIFMSFNWAVENGGIDLRLYQDVSSGTVCGENPVDVCEHLFRLYNLSRPDGYTGRSMSCSDIVSLIDVDDGSASETLWYCDSFGFKQIAAGGLVPADLLTETP